MSSYLEEKVLNHTFRGENFDALDNVYLALFTDQATGEDLEDGVLDNEIEEYDGYRPPINFSQPEQIEGVATIENEEEIEFTEMPEGTVEYAAVMDSEVQEDGGNILYWLEPSNGSRSVEEGDMIVVPAGDVVLELD